MNIDNLTYGELKAIAAMFANSPALIMAEMIFGNRPSGDGDGYGYGYGYGSGSGDGYGDGYGYGSGYGYGFGSGSGYGSSDGKDISK